MEMEEKVRRKIKIHRLFMHPHIIRLYEVIETPTNIYFVMEYVNTGELYDYIVAKGRLRDNEARRFFQQIILGVEYCHQNMTSCGSPNYAAPEVISGEFYAGPEVDIWSCGVILYIPLCDSLPFHDESISNLFKKIKGGIYSLPSHLSGGVRDLILRMLVVDPTKRITIPGIRQHSWFQAHLLCYLAMAPPDTTQQVKKIDEEILEGVVKLCFDRNSLIESIHNRIQDEGTVSYYLLLDNRPRAINGYFGADFEGMEKDSSHVHLYENATAISHRLSGLADNHGILRQHFPAGKSWALGLQSRAHPCEVMMEVLEALKKLNVAWKKIDHYNMACKWLPSFSYRENDLSFPIYPNNMCTDESTISGIHSYLVRFEFQLYKTRDAKYLLDLQMIEGAHLLFLELCAALLQQLGVQ